MRIALVCPYDWSRHGGVKAHVQELARQLSAAHEVRVFAPASQDTAEDMVTPLGKPVGVRFNRSVAPVALSPLAARRTARALAAYAPDVVHVHEPLVPAVSLAASRVTFCPVVGTFHSWSDRDRLYRMVSPVGRRVAAGLAVRIAVSPAAQGYAAAALRMPHGSFRVVPNGVDDQRFATAEPIAELVDRDRPLLLFVGRIEPRKGLDVLIRAFLRLRAARPDVRLCVVGDGPERGRCQQMIPDSIASDVLFAGSVAEAEKARYHASADLYIAPNIGGESFGIVLLEAMAAGLPVVAGDIPGFRGVMKDGRQGRLVPPGNAFALASAIETLLANPTLRRAMAAEGRQTAQEYAWPVVAARIEAIYTDAVART